MSIQDPVIEMQPCGCKTTTLGSRVTYEPCLSCALTNAGIMLQQAGLRMTEAAEADHAEAEERAKAARIRSEDFIGGND